MSPVPDEHAIYDGIVDELNRRWNGTEFYFYKRVNGQKWHPTSSIRNGVIGQQSVAGRYQREVLCIYIIGEWLHTETVQVNGQWALRRSLNLQHPRCLDHLYDIVAKELHSA